MQIWIGTSGYSYPDWVGEFYPPGTPATRMLEFYTQQFPLVELNYTYYLMPSAEALDKLAVKTPAGFQFLIKLHQSLTHELDIRQAPLFREAVAGLHRQGVLLGLLAQLPQRFHHEPASLQYLDALGQELAGLPLAVEFRHVSWNRPEIPDWLREHGWTLVSVDVPRIGALYPSGLCQNGATIYVRFHSRRAESWYSDEKSRYDYLYNDDELQEWVDALVEKQDQAERALLLFNNCHGAQAAINARRIRQLFRQRQAPVEVVSPVGAPPQESDEEKQGVLF